MAYGIIFDGEIEIVVDWYSYDSNTKIFTYEGKLKVNDESWLKLDRYMSRNTSIKEIKILDSNGNIRTIGGNGKIVEHEYHFDEKNVYYRGVISF